MICFCCKGARRKFLLAILRTWQGRLTVHTSLVSQSLWLRDAYRLEIISTHSKSGAYNLQFISALHFHETFFFYSDLPTQIFDAKIRATIIQIGMALGACSYRLER